MSGALGSIAQIAGIAGVANNVIGLIRTNVYLGPVIFYGIQVPEQMGWGGAQRTVRHVSPGGHVVISMMGVDHPQLAWSGFFEGASAATFARRVYLMMVRGGVERLSWLDKSFAVVVREFTATDINANWVQYQIALDVLYDELLGPPRPGAAGILEIVTQALREAQAYADVAQDVIQRMQAVTAATSALTRGDRNTLALQADNTAAIAALRAERARQDAETNRLALQAPAGALLPSAAPTTAAGNVLASVAAAAGSARASRAEAQMTRLGVTLAGVAA